MRVFAQWLDDLKYVLKINTEDQVRFLKACPRRNDDLGIEASVSGRRFFQSGGLDAVRKYTAGDFEEC